MLCLDTKPFSDNSAMCDYPAPPLPVEHRRLQEFHSSFSIRKFSGSFSNYYNPSDVYATDFDAEAVYQELQSPRETYASPPPKALDSWTGDDIIAWLFDVAQQQTPIREDEIPFQKFRNFTGYELNQMTREQLSDLMYFSGVSLEKSRRNAELVYEQLEKLRMPSRDSVVVRNPVTSSYLYTDSYPTYEYCPEYSPYEQGPNPRTVVDDFDHPNFSPDYSHGSDTSRSEDEHKHLSQETKRLPGRPPGRPRGSGKKPINPTKNVSVPQFIASLLHDPAYCPDIIRWEDYSILQFRFVKADEVAKLWGLKKQNQKMSFEKFSRAMRYHYKNEVLKSVPSIRLVYQFGANGKNLVTFTNDPNFEKTKMGISL